MTLDSRITFSRASVATYFNVSGVLTTAATDTPRFDYDPVTHVAKGLLIEEARTNGTGNSEDFSHSNWAATGVTVTANQIVCPDGTTSADLLTASATAASLSYPVGVSTGQNYVQSVFAKKGTSNWMYMIGQSIDVPKVWFNINAGTVGTIQAGITSAAIQDVGNGWWRCSFVDVGQAGVENHAIGISDADNSAAVTVGRTIYLWGAQSEAPATVASSYIPSPFGGAVREADVAVLTSTNFSSWYNASAGTFVAEFVLLAASGTRAIISADGGSSAEQILLYSSGTDPKAWVRDGSVTQADIDAGTIAAGTTYKLGISFAANDVAVCLNGGTVGTDTSATMPTPTQLRLGFEGTNYMNGHLRKLKFFNVAKTDAELQALTT